MCGMSWNGETYMCGNFVFTLRDIRAAPCPFHGNLASYKTEAIDGVRTALLKWNLPADVLLRLGSASRGVLESGLH